ncbi:hypothetical protein ES703_23823 [subsurface metagenome]
MRPWAVSSLRPRLRTVSIMPGMEMGAPLLTETSRGLSTSPNRFPVFPSSIFTCSSTSSQRPSGNSPPASKKSLHVLVVIVNPGGTLRPMLVISDRFAPFPPRRDFISLLPSPKA